MTIERRAVLGMAAVVPAWLATGFGARAESDHAESQGYASQGSSVSSRDPDAPTRAAIVRALALGKPLLVLVVPDDAVRADARGRAWGEYLAHLTDAQAIDLALCEVVCARFDTIARVVPNSTTTCDKECWAVLSELGRAERTCVPVHVDAAIVAAAAEAAPGSREAVARDAEFETRLRAAILPSPKSLSERATHAASAIPHEELGRTVVHQKGFETTWEQSADTDDAGLHVAFLSDGGPARWRDLDRWAAHVRVQAQLTPARPERLAALAQAVRLRLFESAPSGATWHVRVTEISCPPCGMARTTSVSRHFLRFYTQ